MGQTLLNTTDFHRELQLIFNQSASKQFSSPWTLEEYDGVGSSKSRFKVLFDIDVKDGRMRPLEIFVCVKELSHH